MTKCTRCGEDNPAEIHTCTPQSKAQRLANALDLVWTGGLAPEAASELRRLDALNAELVEACKTNWLPEHKCGLYLTHNEHKDLYESAEEWIENRQFEDDFVSPEEMQKAIQEDSIWRLQWYPETPVGFYSVAASSLEALEHAVRKAKEQT